MKFLCTINKLRLIPLEIINALWYNYKVTSLYDRGVREHDEESPSITEQGS